MTPDQHTPELSLYDYIRPVLSRWWLVLIVAVTATVGTYLFYEAKPKVYEASTRLFTQNNDSYALVLGAQFSSYVTPTTLQNQAELISSGLFTRRAEQILKGPTNGSVSASAADNSDFVTITGRAETGKQAAAIANAYAQAYIDITGERARKALEQGLAKSQQQVANLPVTRANAEERATLASNVRRIKLALQLPVGNTSQLNPAFAPGVPLSPKPKRNAIFAFVLSVLVGIAAAFGLERFDRRLKRVEDAELMYGAPVLSVLPHVEDPNAFDAGRVAVTAEFAEAFRQLRTNIQLTGLERPIRRILITSAVSGEGKSTVARNLAVIFREFGKTVTVVDADLRRPSLGKLFATDVETGLTSVLTGAVTLDDAVLNIPVAARGLDALARIEAAALTPSDDRSGLGEDTRERGVELLPAGGLPANPQAILSARRTDEILFDLQERSDILIIDSSPVALVSDALSLAADADAIILVSRLGMSRRDKAAAARAALARVPQAKVIGVVVNDLSGPGANAYTYGYGPDA